MYNSLNSGVSVSVMPAMAEAVGGNGIRMKPGETQFTTEIKKGSVFVRENK